MRGVAGGLWGIVSIAHSLKSDDVEGVGDMGMYMERGEAGSVRQAGRGGSRSVAQHGGAQLIAASHFRSQTSREDLPPCGPRNMLQNGRLNNIFQEHIWYASRRVSDVVFRSFRRPVSTP